MAVKSKTGGFSIGAGTTGNLAIVQSGTDTFTPKFSLKYWSAEDTEGARSAFLHKRGFSMTDGVDQFCITSHSENGSPAGDSGQAQYGGGAGLDRVIQFLTSTEGDDGHSTQVSFDAAGETINRVVGAFFNHRVNYLHLGGDIEVRMGEFLDPAAAGNQVISGLGASFKPTLIIFMGIGSNLQVTVDSRMFLGFAALQPDGTIANLVWLGASNNGSDPTETKSYCRLGECCAHFEATVATINELASVTAIGYDGFTVNFSQVGGGNNRRHFYAAIDMKGAPCKIVGTASRTDTADITISGQGFKPVAGLFLSANEAENASDTPHDDDKWSLGTFASSGALNDAAMATFDDDAAATADVGVAADAAGSVYLHISASAFVGIGNIDSLDAGGLTWHCSDADDAANFVGAVLIGDGTTSILGGKNLAGSILGGLTP